MLEGRFEIAIGVLLARIGALVPTTVMLATTGLGSMLADAESWCRVRREEKAAMIAENGSAERAASAAPLRSFAPSRVGKAARAKGCPIEGEPGSESREQVDVLEVWSIRLDADPAPTTFFRRAAMLLARAGFSAWQARDGADSKAIVHLAKAVRVQIVDSQAVTASASAGLAERQQRAHAIVAAPPSG